MSYTIVIGCLTDADCWAGSRTEMTRWAPLYPNVVTAPSAYGQRCVASMRPAIVPSIWSAPAPSSAAIGRVERHIADAPVEQWADYSLTHWECTG